MYGEINTETFITIYKIDVQWEFAIISQETQSGALYQPREAGRGVKWVGGSQGRGYMYTYGWLIVKSERKQ